MRPLGVIESLGLGPRSPVQKCLVPGAAMVVMMRALPSDAGDDARSPLSPLPPPSPGRGRWRGGRGVGTTAPAAAQ